MNKHAAEQCVAKAKEYILNQEFDKATKFLLKGKRLDKSVELDCNKLLEEVEELKKAPQIGGKLYHPNTVNEYDELMKGVKKDQLVCIDYFALWCGPCKMIAPIFEKFASQYKDVVLIKVDVDNSSFRGLMQKYEITSMPTFIFLKNGVVVDKLSGASEQELENKIINNK